MLQSIRSVLLVSATVLLPLAVTVRADSISAVQTFSSQMGSWNVITSGSFNTDNHVHGGVAVGGNALFSGNAEINSHGKTNAESLRVYGDLKLTGTNNKVMAGGATVVKNGTVNADLTLKPGQPNPNQARITSATGSLTFNGNGGTPTLSTLIAADSFFSSRDGLLQSANTDLLNATGALNGVTSGNKLTFKTETAGVSVFNWNIDKPGKIGEVEFKLATDSFAVINIIGNSFSSTWNAGFNFLGGSDFLASNILWNIGVETVNFKGSELFGSILAPDSTINSSKQLTGSLYAASLKQRGQQIHQGIPNPPHNVPESASTLVLAMAGVVIGLAVWARRFLGVNAS